MTRFDALSSALDQKAVIMKNGRSATKDALGQYHQQDQIVATVPASVVPQTGSLLSGRAAETQLSRTTHKVVIRYRNDVKPDMWLLIGGQRYNILYILDPFLKHVSLEIFCEVTV